MLDQTAGPIDPLAQTLLSQLYQQPRTEEALWRSTISCFGLYPKVPLPETIKGYLGNLTRLGLVRSRADKHVLEYEYPDGRHERNESSEEIYELTELGTAIAQNYKRDHERALKEVARTGTIVRLREVL